LSSGISIVGVSKTYGGVRALREVSFDILPGEVHALCGENGAGKSTLNKVLCGAVTPEQGHIRVNGKPLKLGSVAACEAGGIAIVHQESVAFPYLGAADNVFVGHELTKIPSLWLDKKRMRSKVREILTRLGEKFNPNKPLNELSVAQRQMVGIARALSRSCKLLILDEPTASLSETETNALFSVIKQLREQGVSILYVSHRLKEVFELADRVTVLRDGAYVGTRLVKEIDNAGLIQMMVGREIGKTNETPCHPGKELLRVENLSIKGIFEDISFSVRCGEVVGLAGLVGAGRTEVAQAIAGLMPLERGKVIVDGIHVRIGSINQAMRQGIGYVAEDRQHEGLVLPMSVSDNLTLASLKQVQTKGFLSDKKEAQISREQIKNLAIKTENEHSPVESLSGGNQQKVLLGKWLTKKPRILILDEPTRGVDVGAKAEVHRLIEQLKEQGIAIIVISSELPEILSLSDRVVVLREGSVAGELTRGEATQEKVLELALPDKENQSSKPKKEAVKPLWMQFAQKREYGVAALLLLTIIAVSIVNPDFLQLQNISNMMVNLSGVAIVACGITLVILCREIDISFGATMGLCSVIMGVTASRMHYPMPVVIASMLVTGTIIGLLNGFLIALFRIPSIIVTLGMATIVKGASTFIMGGKWISDIPDGLRFWGTSSFLSVPICVWVAIFVVVMTWILLIQTPLGRRIYAVGNNPRAAELAGVSNRMVRMFVFGFTGFVAAIATLVSATQLQVVENGFGEGKDLLVITCVVVGGTSIRGGRGTIIGSILGVVLLGIVSTVLIFLKLGEMSTYWEKAIQGAFIIVAVLLDHITRRGEHE
jgi:ABC-type sugar transport system ATPase subunit/ribose/xylose/arabinose/galactoside ABC-type transport system permease subunit